MKKTYDHYKEAMKIAKNLANKGYEDWSRRILDEIESGSTGGEILSGLKMQFNEMKMADLNISSNDKRLIEDLISRINEVINSA